MRVPVAPYPFQKLLLSVILISAILKCVRWPPHCVDLTFSCDTNYNELFSCLLAIWIFFWDGQQHMPVQPILN